MLHLQLLLSLLPRVLTDFVLILSPFQLQVREQLHRQNGYGMLELDWVVLLNLEPNHR